MRRSHLSVVAISALLASCAAGPAPRTGFLGDYSGLARVGSSDSLLEQRPSPHFDVAEFHGVFIEPTEVRVDGLSEAEKQQLSDVFRAALVERLNGALPLVGASGRGVIKVRTAIVEARKANVAANVVTSLLAVPVTRGGVAAEAEVVDGGSGQRIAALAWARRGGKISEIGLSYTQLGEARSGLRAFAYRLADLFSLPREGRAERAPAYGR